MGDRIYYVLGMAITGIIFMPLSRKYDGRQSLWMMMPFQIKKRWWGFVWLISAIIIQLMTQIVIEQFIDHQKTINMILGITLGLCVSVMPIASKNERKDF